ncbi:MAG: hypothetical protein A3G20_07015 [Acidobacteria bacterium RIFCSPLOWO2_12_FULL_59_11]|nr:MAG: hypothetical protein A3G20_07015 [Acidobacteria bacterium RIFCSPLOWO2_12_FULL_59_11]OFW21191.1 MAG: hypothetical protein A3H27_08980 [Acidobacteria bacterium RIFCSPLOWO2_02_FULL_59_13]
MTKEDLIWVVIRATGFLLLVRAVLYIPEIASAGVWLSYLPDPSGTATEGLRMSVGVERQHLISSILYVLIYGVLGLYLLRKGDWIYRLLSFRGPERSNNTVERDARKSGARPSP